MSEQIVRYRRYSGERDFHLGPFVTLARAERGYRPWGVRLGSGHGEYPGCHLQFQAAGHTLIFELPPIIKPWRKWVDTSHYEWSNPHGGYYDEHAREYGFGYSDGFLQVYLGAQTHSSDTTQQWSKFLPWTQWRHVRKSWYDLEGRHFATELRANRWEAQKAVEEACPSAAFLFDDYDGQRITATTRIVEMEWYFGEGWFKWLSLFRRPKVSRSLRIEFSAEVGPEKGSWKGGTLGHDIEMLPGELHEAAFRRYCDKGRRHRGNKFRLTFIGCAHGARANTPDATEATETPAQPATRAEGQTETAAAFSGGAEPTDGSGA